MFSKQIVQLVLALGINGLVSLGASISQASPLLSAIDARQSMVMVRAVHTELKATPNAEAAIDPKTGRILIARKILTAHQEQKGAGIIINQEGLIVTNYHTIQGAQKLGVQLQDGTLLPATIVHLRSDYDLVLLRINPPLELHPIHFANSNLVKLRDPIFHIGTSTLLDDTISQGIITGIGKTHFDLPFPLPKDVELIQVNINIYKGDSGGPLLNNQGELIGIIVAKKTSKQKVAYAIPSNKIKKLYLDFIK